MKKQHQLRRNGVSGNTWRAHRRSGINARGAHHHQRRRRNGANNESIGTILIAVT